VPLPLLAHQAPVLPLKLWRPTAFNGTALVIGSMAPDFEYFVDTIRRVPFGHILRGQFGFCLPITMVLVLGIGHLRLGEVIAARLPGLAWLRDAATDVTTEGGLVRAVASALAGSFSHVVLDLLTHDWIPRLLPQGTFHFLGVTGVTSTVVQLVASVGCAVVTMVLLRRLVRRSAATSPPARPGGAVLGACAALGVVIALARSLPALRQPHAYFDAGPVYVWGQTAFFLACGFVGGVLAGAVPLAVWDRRAA
jgi:membrane-bound metal-dependent hydrolase YbcI (DUF457 family)